MRRVRDFRATYNLTLTEPIALNVAPVSAAIAIADANRSLLVLNDRAQGGTSLAAGQVDLFLHRRR